MANREQGNFVIERHEAFDNHAARMARAAFVLRNIPGLLDVGFGLDDALAVARGTHHRLDHARNTDFLDCRLEIFKIISETVRARLDAEFFGGQTADTFAVHSKLGSLGRRNDVVAFLFKFHERISRNGFDFGNNVVRRFQFNHTAKFGTIEHVNHVATMSHLHTRSVGITVHGDDFDAETHHFDDDFFA